jgi:hypothetical protein
MPYTKQCFLLMITFNRARAKDRWWCAVLKSGENIRQPDNEPQRSGSDKGGRLQHVAETIACSSTLYQNATTLFGANQSPNEHWFLAADLALIPFSDFCYDV